MTAAWLRPTRAEVDAARLRGNVERLAGLVAPAELLVAVKAGGYGHGALVAARAALAGGARWLGVATVDEGSELRAAGLDATVLVLSRAVGAAVEAAVAAAMHLVVDSPESVADVEAAAARLGTVANVHLVVDTGMRRLGCTPDEAVDLATSIVASSRLRLAGTGTHLARADEPEVAANRIQLERFDAVLSALRERGIDPGVVHAANSAAGLSMPSARRDLVRVGIAAYGIRPGAGIDADVELLPALRLVSEVVAVRSADAGDGVSYGHRYTAGTDERLATVPVGYADGVRRDAGLRGVEVLIGGRRRPIRGVVTMDQTVVGVDGSVAVGDPVVVIGRQGDEEITAAEVAARLDTIPYEVLSTIGHRVPRVTV